MTLEVDCIVKVHDAAGAPGIVTDINTPHVHASGSLHYARGTSSPSGGQSTAVDFGGANGPLNLEDTLKVFDTFVPYAQEGKLAELYCGEAEYCVYRGSWLRWTSVPKRVRDILRPQHQNHIHVAVKAGVFLEPHALPTKPTIDEDDDMSDALTITYANGHKTVVTPDGAVKNAGTPFFGSIYDVPAADRRDWVTCFAATAIDPDDESKGYRLWNDRPNSKYEFTPEWWANHNKK